MRNKSKFFFMIVCFVFLILILQKKLKVFEEKKLDFTVLSENSTSEKHIVIYTSHPVDFVIPLLEEFESRYSIRVNIKYSGSGEIIDTIIQNKIKSNENREYDNIDILWGGSLSTLKPHTDLFEYYISINELFVQEQFKNIEGNLTRFSDIPSVLMMNRDLIGSVEIKGYKDLLNPKLKGKIAYSNPYFSSSAYEHLINMLYAMGEGDPGFSWNFIEEFICNLDGKLLNSSKEVYEGVLNGEFIVGLIFEEVAIALQEEKHPIEIVYMEEGVISTPDCVSIIKDADNIEQAKLFIDFVTNKDTQQLLSKELNRRSIRKDVELETHMVDKSNINIITVDQDEIIRKKVEWIQNFRNIYYQITMEEE